MAGQSFLYLHKNSGNCRVGVKMQSIECFDRKVGFLKSFLKLTKSFLKRLKGLPNFWHCPHLFIENAIPSFLNTFKSSSFASS